MKINIGTYRNYITSTSVAEKVFGINKSKEEYGELTKWGKRLASLLGNIGFRNVVKPFNNIKRSIKIEIDDWDVWSLDHTLALIITPALKLLKEKTINHGYAIVNNEDVPEEFHTAEYDNDDIDEKGSAKWIYVIDEMIFAFETSINDYEDSFYSGISDVEFVPIDDGKFFKMKKTEKDTSKFDIEGHTKWKERQKNGLRLFAKYYFNLWS